MKKPFINQKSLSIFGCFLLSLLLCCGPGRLSAQALIEEGGITLKMQNAAIPDILETITKQYDYAFIVLSSDIDLQKRISLDVTDEPLKNVLGKIFAGNDVEFEIDGRLVRISKASRPVKVAANSLRTIQGTVKEPSGSPIPGVSVVIRGTSAGNVTDSEGRFSLSVDDRSVLRFTCLGYQSVEEEVGKRSMIEVVMQEDLTRINDIVVVGYGTQKKVNLTGAVSVVESAQLKNRQSSSVNNMLQGMVPGVNVTTSSGLPGNPGSVNIRGITSINGGNPLVLIDGIQGDLHKVNPSDVESISVLKDASSAAVYGARAAFGVILVTTKSADVKDDGKTTTSVSYSGRWGFGRPTTSTDFETRGYYSVWLNDMFMTAATGTPYTRYIEADYDELWSRRNDKTEHPDRPWVKIDQRSGKDTYVYYGNTDWYHYLYKDVRPTMSQDISLRGGNSKVQYSLSGNYYSEEGIMRQNPDTYRRINFRSKINFAINKWLTMSNNTSYYNYNFNYNGISPLNNHFNLDRVHGLASFVPVNPDGTSVYQTPFMNYSIMDGLPVILNKGLHTNRDFNDEMSTSTSLQYKPVKGLTITGDFTYMFTTTRYSNRQVNGEYSLSPGETSTLTTGTFEDRLAETVYSHNYYVANLFATYETTFGENHNLKVMGGYNYETRVIKDVKGTGYNLLSETLSDLNLVGNAADGTRKESVGGGYNEYALAGVYGRINYDYKGKYLLEFSGRYDGTSRFRSDHRWGFFPSFSLGWRISEEAFFAPAAGTVNNLKLRFSFGTLGNQQVGYYDYIRQISLGTQTYLFGGNQLPSIAKISAPVASDLTWERTEHSNLGLDMDMLNNRLSMTADFYIRDTKDMLAPGKALPETYGADSPRMNSADLRTKGYELTLAWRDHFKMGDKPFSYNVSVVFSDHISEITRYDNPDRSLAQPHYAGKRWGEIWGLRTDGYFLSDEEARTWHINQSSVNSAINSAAGAENGLRAGDVKFRDLNGDNIISIGQNRVGETGDYVVIGNSQPRYNYGINIGADWNGIDFSVFFQGIGRRDWYPDSDNTLFFGAYARPYSTYLPKNFHTQIWSEDNPNAYFPRPRGYTAFTANSELTVKNDKYLQNIGYCRLKSLTVGYTLPQRWTSRILIESLRVYFVGENLLTWSSLHSPYIDPELANANAKAKTYPYQKMFIFGVDVNF